MKNVLTIAGSDSSAGAGIQADLKTFSAMGVYGLSAITSITAQNSQEVRLTEDVSEEMLSNQIDVLFEDITIDAVKIGMINSKRNAEIIYEKLKKYEAKNIVLDPVMISTTGKELLRADTKEFLIEKLFKITDLITPNLSETREIIRYIFSKNMNIYNGTRINHLNLQNLTKSITTTLTKQNKFAKRRERQSDTTYINLKKKYKPIGKKKIDKEIENINSFEKMKEYGEIISNYTGNWVLIKGGHLLNEAFDVLVKQNVTYIIPGKRINSKNTHGTGCTLSSSIAANLAKGYSILEAVNRAKKFISYAIENSIDFGKENGPINQFGEIYKKIDIEKLYG